MLLRRSLTCQRVSLRRRFEQNQEDCTFTVLALLPTATTSILEAMNTESITYEIQQMKTSSRAAARPAASDSTGPPSIADTNLTEDDGRSMMSLQSDSVLHASQTALPPTDAAAPNKETGQQERAVAKPRKSKRQLWDDLTISGMNLPNSSTRAVGATSFLRLIRQSLQ
jgi:peroxin-3